MAKKMLIDATHAEETRVVVVDGNKVEEFDFESENKRQLAGNIYLAKVTRVEPSLQAAFVDYGGNRHGFLAFSEIHPDYYQIPVADREALMEEERAYGEAMKARDEAEESKPKKRRSRSRTKAADVKSDDAVESIEVSSEPTGMETIDLDEGEEAADLAVPEGTSPVELVGETPVEEPVDDADAPEEAEGAAEDAGQEPEAEPEKPRVRKKSGPRAVLSKQETQLPSESLPAEGCARAWDQVRQRAVDSSRDIQRRLSRIEEPRRDSNLESITEETVAEIAAKAADEEGDEEDKGMRVAAGESNSVDENTPPAGVEHEWLQKGALSY